VGAAFQLGAKFGVGRYGGIEKTSLISLTSEERRTRPRMDVREERGAQRCTQEPASRMHSWRLSSVQARNLTSATSLGRTRCTRPTARGIRSGRRASAAWANLQVGPLRIS